MVLKRGIKRTPLRLFIRNTCAKLPKVKQGNILSDAYLRSLFSKYKNKNKGQWAKC